MKNFIASFITLLVLLAGTLTTVEVTAQTSWVECENVATGARQSFPNRCPFGWVRV